MRNTSLSVIDALYTGHLNPYKFLQKIDNFDDWLETECETKSDLLCVLSAFEGTELPDHIEKIKKRLNNQ